MNYSTGLATGMLLFDSSNGLGAPTNIGYVVASTFIVLFIIYYALTVFNGLESLPYNYRGRHILYIFTLRPLVIIYRGIKWFFTNF